MTNQQPNPFKTKPLPSLPTEEEAKSWEEDLEFMMEHYSIGSLISFIMEWGYGSGEEAHDYLSTHGLTYEEATIVCDLLNKVKPD